MSCSQKPVNIPKNQLADMSQLRSRHPLQSVVIGSSSVSVRGTIDVTSAGLLLSCAQQTFPIKYGSIRSLWIGEENSDKQTSQQMCILMLRKKIGSKKAILLYFHPNVFTVFLGHFSECKDANTNVIEMELSVFYFLLQTCCDPFAFIASLDQTKRKRSKYAPKNTPKTRTKTRTKTKPKHKSKTATEVKPKSEHQDDQLNALFNKTLF